MVLRCQIFLANTDRLLNSAVHKWQNYDQIRTVVSIDLGSYQLLIKYFKSGIAHSPPKLSVT